MANTTGKKFGGRSKGTPNKTTAEIKDLINQFISMNVKDLQDTYNKLEPEKRLQFFEKLLRFVIPTQQANELNINTLSESELDILIEKITNNLK